MAIVTDPDNLDRNQVIYATIDELISLYPVGALTDVTATGTDGVTVNGTKNFTSATALFTTTNVVSPGDILCIYSGQDTGHYVIDTVDSAVQLTLIAAANFAPGDTAQEYEVREPTGGSIEDGATEQAIYSFSKEEWHTDGETFGGDDLIRHEFPFEGITPNQFEIGGGLAHNEWDWFNDYTRKKIRHGGWDVRNSSSTSTDLWAGMVSLGPMQAAAQAYFQQTSATTAPQDFEFTGPVNEAVQIFGLTTYFKNFLRYKGYSYASYDLLTEQQISALGGERYQFPLSHTADPAIVADDGELLGAQPYSNWNSLSSGTDGITTVSTGTFTNTAATDFAAAGVVAGDVLYLSTGTDAGYYEITDVTTVTITVDTNNADFTTFAGDTAITFNVHTRNILTGISDGALANVDGDTGTFTSTAGGFVAAGVTTGDMLVITEAASAHRGVYKVVSRTSDTALIINTSDRAFTTVGTIDAYIVEPGMYFEYKWDEITIGATTTLAFADNNPDTITRGGGSWVSDGVEVGDIITISGSVSNNGDYTVAEVTSAVVLTLVATDSLSVEGAGSFTATCHRGYVRTLNGVNYAFKWRLFSNGGDLSECYQYHQYQMRLATDIDWGASIARGDITNLMLTYVAPNAVTTNLCIDNLDGADANNVTYYDATGVSRSEKYLAAGSITFNTNLVNDGVAIYHMFFLNDDAGDNSGYDFGTPNAITVKDSSTTDISGVISGGSVAFDYDYDNNVQRGTGSDSEDAPIVVVCIGLDTAAYVRTDYTITRSKTNTIPCVASLERNYST